jgi:hypothetical protein
VACVGATVLGTDRVSVGGRKLGNLVLDGRIILKWSLKIWA